MGNEILLLGCVFCVCVGFVWSAVHAPVCLAFGLGFNEMVDFINARYGIHLASRM